MREDGAGRPHPAASSAYFSALHVVPLLEGRTFTENDRDGSPRVAIISQGLARILFHDEDPLGPKKILEQNPPADREIRRTIMTETSSSTTTTG